MSERNAWEAFDYEHHRNERLKSSISRIVIDIGIFVALDRGIDGIVHLSDLDWTMPGEEYVARTPGELYKQITKSDPPGKPGDMTALQITNLIGGRGWELSSVNRSKDRRGSDEYWFRRSSR